MRIYTGVGGYELFEEAMEREVLGTERKYLGKKIPRILRLTKGEILKSVGGKFYKRIKISK